MLQTMTCGQGLCEGAQGPSQNPSWSDIDSGHLLC
jgi:hypothetical protein